MCVYVTHVYVLRAPAVFKLVVLLECLTCLRPSAFLMALHFLNYGLVFLHVFPLFL